MKIICFLTVKPPKIFFDFCKRLKSIDYRVSVCIDDDNYVVSPDKDIDIIKINRTICENAGYKNLVAWFTNRACSREKALYYYNRIDKTDWTDIWFIEEDVFVPTVDTIRLIDQKESNRTADLLSASNSITTPQTDMSGWWWPLVLRHTKLNPPYSSSMICAIRVSKQMMMYIDQYAKQHLNMFMDEAFFNTIALKNNLIVITPLELAPIDCCQAWRIGDIDRFKLYHPVKNIQQQYVFREYIETGHVSDHDKHLLDSTTTSYSNKNIKRHHHNTR